MLMEDMYIGCVGFEVLLAMTVKSAVFWAVTLYGLVEVQ
jgi:hypothetical protein